MCGRFSLTTPGPSLRDAFSLSDLPGDLPARYNVAPSQAILAIRQEGDRRIAESRVWGLVPRWAKDAKLGPINARAETAAEKPMFRGALRQRRCLVPADGFFEWRKVGGKKIPYYFQVEGGAPFAIAALWEGWEGQGKRLETVTLLTTEPNSLVGAIHDRMPVVIAPGDYDRWLDSALTDPAAIADLFAAFPADRMAARPVGTRVNSPAADDPSCLEPAPPGAVPETSLVVPEQPRLF